MPPTFPGLTIDTHHGLTRLNLATPAATATVYLHGAHLAAWQPTGAQPVLFLSDQSEFAATKPIRGGVPVIFPWFGPRTLGPRTLGPRTLGPDTLGPKIPPTAEAPMHGFARIQDWDFTAATLLPDDTAVLTFELGPTALSRSLGYDHFHLTLEHHLGSTLTMRLTVRNEGPTPLPFEAALHTYFAIADIHNITVTGLEPTAFIDKTNNFAYTPAAHQPITFTGPTDRVYADTTATCTISDSGRQRRIHIAKSGSATTVVWNPGKPMPDLTDWPGMVCVETANAATNALTLAPGAAHTMQATITVDPMQ